MEKPTWTTTARRVKTKDVLGSAKETAGKAVGNKDLERRGKADQAEGKVQKGFGEAKDGDQRASATERARHVAPGRARPGARSRNGTPVAAAMQEMPGRRGQRKSACPLRPIAHAFTGVGAQSPRADRKSSVGGDAGRDRQPGRDSRWKRKPSSTPQEPSSTSSKAIEGPARTSWHSSGNATSPVSPPVAERTRTPLITS